MERPEVGKPEFQKGHAAGTPRKETEFMLETTSLHFNLVDQNGAAHPTGQPVNDRDQALAVAKRLAIDIAETRQEDHGNGCFVSVIDGNGGGIHREGVDSAEKSG